MRGRILLLFPLNYLSDSVTRFFSSGFFRRSSSPKPLIISTATFRIFFLIRWDIRRSRTQGAPPVSTKPVANNGNNTDCLNLWSGHEEKMYLFVNPTNKKCVDKKFKILLIEDFFYLPTTIVNTGGAPWAVNFYANFWRRKKLKWPIIRCPGKIIYKKNPKLKIS